MPVSNPLPQHLTSHAEYPSRYPSEYPSEYAPARPTASLATRSAGRATSTVTDLETEQVRQAAGPLPTAAPETEDSDAHLLRLCLDLQLDALMLTLGAAASAHTESAKAGYVPAAGGDDLPWRRWLTEDVDLAVTLASDTQAGRATLPSTLGTELDHAVPATVVDSLEARYRSMRSLLADVLATQPARGGAWRPRLREALERCEQRLTELDEHRLDVTPPRGIPLSTEHHYLPGELLG